MLIRFVIILILFISHFSVASESEVTEEVVDDYINKVGLERAVAQLFVVGIPTDYKNSTGANDFDVLISELNVGGVMLNGYNLPHTELRKDERNTAFQLASSLIRLIKQYDSNDGIYPLLTYVDFESYNFSSIKYPIIPPPSPLVLASTGDTKYSYYAGKVAGDQLRQLGVNVILGPVLDLDKSNQGEPNFAIATRAFSDNNKLLVSYAKAFLDGINDTGVSSFAKHFPTYGAVFTNAHKESSIYTGALMQLEQDLRNFESLSDYFDGVMTSHLVVKEISESKPATFNRELVDEYLSNNDIFNDKIIITDDLSNMESSKNYIRKRYGSFDYSNSTINAFKAGHDIMLYSHISGSNGVEHSEFNIKELKCSIEALKNIIEDDALYMRQFKDSLRKILILKSKHVNSRVANKLDINGYDIFEDESEFRSINEFYNKTFDSALINLSHGDMVDLADLNQNLNIFFIGSQPSLDLYNKYLEGEYQGQFVQIENNYRSAKSFTRAKKKLLSVVEDADVVVFIAETTDHINLLDTVRLKTAAGLSKFIVFLHGSPHLINYDLINSVKIYGNFSKNPSSYLSDIKLLRGEIKSRPISYLPLSIANGSIHDSNNSVEPVSGNYSSDRILVFNTRYEKELHYKLTERDLENAVLKKQVAAMELGNNSYTSINKKSISISIILSILLSLFFVVKVVKDSDNCSIKESCSKITSLIKDCGWLKLVVLKKFLLILILLILIFPSLGLARLLVDSVSEYIPGVKPFLQFVLPEEVSTKDK